MVLKAMYSGVSGLRAEGEALGVVGDNIANVNTTGFKAQRALFEDVLGHSILAGTSSSMPGSGVGVPVAFTQDRASDKTVVQIQDANGKIVRTLDLGSRPVGISKITWDGRSDDGLVQPAGTYAVSVKSNDADGGTVSVSQETSGTITGVAFDKGYPVLRLSNGVSAPVSDLLRVESPPKTP